MADFGTDFNIQSFVLEPSTLVDEVSPTEFYIGTSKSGGNQDGLNWQIKHIVQDGTVWMFQFPNGDQAYSFAWSQRTGYTYS